LISCFFVSIRVLTRSSDASGLSFGVRGCLQTINGIITSQPGTVRPLILTALGTLATSCSITVESFEMLAAQIEGLAVLAEREIYEGGTWPGDEPYPVSRNRFLFRRLRPLSRLLSADLSIEGKPWANFRPHGSSQLAEMLLSPSDRVFNIRL
jgi:hypothetical protein